MIFFTLPSLLFFGFLYLKYDESLPKGTQGTEANQLAQNMLDKLDYDAFHNTDYLEWTVKGIHHYKWYKTDKTCEVSWDQMTVILDLENHNSSKVFAGQQEYNGKEKHKRDVFFRPSRRAEMAHHPFFDSYCGTCNCSICC